MEELNILIVDDDENLLEQGKIFLEKQDERLSVETTTSPEEAFQRVKGNGFDGIISDYQMPEIDGLELLEKIRSEGIDIPFIIFTGKSREEVAMDALNLGADRYLQKKRDPTSQYGVLADAILDEIRHWRDQKSLKKSEEEKRLVLDNTSEIIVHQDLDHNIQWANEAAVSESDVDREDIKGKKCYEVLRSIERPCDNCPVEKTIDIEESEEAKVVTSEGKIWLVSSNPLFDEEGDSEGVVEVITDITERRKAEMMADQVLDSMKDAVLIQDADGVIEKVNPAVEEISGYSEEQVIGKKSTELAKEWIKDEEDLERGLDAIGAIMEGRSYSPIVITIETKDGEEIPVSLKGSVIKDEKGSIVKTIITARDISRLKYIEKELKKSEKKYKTIFESASDAIIIMDREKFTDCNEKALELFNLSREEFVGKEPWALSPNTQPDGRSSKEKALKKIRSAMEGEPQFFEWVHEKSDGSPFEAEVSLDSFEVDGEKKVISIVRDVSTRKKAQEKFRRLFEASPDGTFLINRDGEIEAVNDAVEDILGMERTELIGSKFTELEAPTEESLENLKENFRRRMNGEKVEPYIIEYESKDGKRKFSEVNSQPVREGGEISGVVAVIRDVTKRKEARKALRKRESQLEAIMDGSGDSIYMVDRDCKYVLVNKELLSRLGVGREEEVLGKRFHEFHNEKESKEFEEKVNRVFETGKSLKHEHKKEETDRWYLRTFSPIKSSDGKVKNISIVSKDITDYKELENSLRNTKDRYKKLFDGADELIFTTNLEGYIRKVNERTVEVLGYNEGELIGESLLVLAHDEDKEEFEELIKKAREGGECSRTVKVLDNDGDCHWLNLKARPIQESGGIVELQYSGNDITKRRERKEKEEFLHSLLRHDLKNKLQLINNSFILLEKETGLTDEQENYLEMGKNSCKNGIELIEKVRTLRKLEDEEVGRVNVKNIIDRVLAEKEPELRSENVELEKNIKGTEVLGSDLLDALFFNLIENALQHSGADKVRVDTEIQEKYCLISVEDNGKGISDELKNKVFSKGFAKGENSGSGLGMFLAKEIVGKYGGEISVEDSEMGGAKFLVRLQR